MRKTYLFILLLIVLYFPSPAQEDQNQQASIPNLSTTTNAQKAFFQALKKESVPDFQKLLISKEQIAALIPMDQFINDFSKKHSHLSIDSVKKIIQQFFESDEFYNSFKPQDDVFNYTLARGVLIGVKWSEANWKSCDMDSSQRNENEKIYKGNIYFTSRGKSFIIKEEYIKAGNMYTLSKILVPYLDPFGTFQERITSFLNEEVKSHYVYSETAYKKERIDSILLKSESLEVVKGKVLKNTTTKQDFHFLFLKYKDEEGCKAARVTLNELLKLNKYSRETEEMKTAKTNKAFYVWTPTELIILKANCANKKENWLELRNDMVSEFSPSSTIENHCISSNDFIAPVSPFAPPPPPPMPSKKH